MNFYYTDDTGNVSGPVTRTQLLQLVDAGLVSPNSQVCTEGSEDWKPLSLCMGATANAKASAKRVVPPPNQPSAQMGQSPQTGPVKSFDVFVLLALACLGVGILGWLSSLNSQSLKQSTEINYNLEAIKRLLDREETPSRFEYKVIAPSDTLFDLEMNRLGRDGWEIISARRATSGSDYSQTASYEVILKRQLR